MAVIHIGDALKNLTTTGRLASGLKGAQIKDIWEDMMGKTIAKYTDKIEIIQDTLFITTNVGALKNELHFQKTLIIQRVNEVYGAKVIEKVVIQ